MPQEQPWYHDGWQWIDGNKDGISECYYFAPNGYIVTNGKTPDGYDVNADGQWTINGVVQTIGAAAAQATGTANTNRHSFQRRSLIICIVEETQK